MARPLWKEVPRFREIRGAGIEIWHECKDLDLAVWLDSQASLNAFRAAMDRALRRAFTGYVGMQVAATQVDVFLIEPRSDRYLGRLCRFNACPKHKNECLAPGCGAVPFNRVVPDFFPEAELTKGSVLLYRRGDGIIRQAVDLPLPMAAS